MELSQNLMLDGRMSMDTIHRERLQFYFERDVGNERIFTCYFYVFQKKQSNIKSRIYQLSSFVQASHKLKSIEIIFQGFFQLSLNIGTHMYLHTSPCFLLNSATILNRAYTLTSLDPVYNLCEGDYRSCYLPS